MQLKVEHKEIGIMGTGTNMFRTGLAHSSGQVFIGTYGPAPAIVWQYDPAENRLSKIGAPGEYQLDSMVEAPNGMIYIGTAYKGLVYELNPKTGEIRDLGSPPVDSTPWIFTMIRTRDGEIYGAKGVGLFHLDWRTGRMESCGVVPGDHSTGEHGSGPITRTLEERPDGLLWGDTNRWIFTFDPKSREITPVADLLTVDDACYAVLHGNCEAPVNDLYLQVYSRYSGKEPRQRFYRCKAETGLLEPLSIEGLDGFCWLHGWWTDGEKPRLLITHRPDDEAASTIALVDTETEEVIDRWQVEGNDLPPNRLAGTELWFMSGARGTLYRTEPEQKRLRAVAVNPVPVECRCLALSAGGRLGTDSYDCGFVFTRSVNEDHFTDHGRVWIDDHRCNYGPAAFGGEDDRYFLANHSESMSGLWVTDTQTNRHWRVGDSAVQLHRARDGRIWGTQGENPPRISFDTEKCWTPGWQARPGALFRWTPSAGTVETLAAPGPVGPIAELPGATGRMVLCTSSRLRVAESGNLKIEQEESLPGDIVAVAADLQRNLLYCALQDGRVFTGEVTPVGKICFKAETIQFGSIERGFFVLAQSGRLVGLDSEGTVSVWCPESRVTLKTAGPPPLPAGPAISLSEDKWYFADRFVGEYSLCPV